jgi:hypothetical protein
VGSEHEASPETYRTLVLEVISAQRRELERLRINSQVKIDEYNLLLEEIDWCELSIMPDEERRIAEI